jgi:hypothetical protein
VNIEGGADKSAVAAVWKYSHGGDMGGAKAPRTEGWPQDGVSNQQHYGYNGFHLAKMCPGCAPSPLACNTTAQGGEAAAYCCVMPAAETATAANGFDKLGWDSRGR